MRGRIGNNLPNDDEVNEFVTKSKLELGFWRNSYSTCQIHSLFVSLTVFPRFLKRQLALSDDDELGYFRPSYYEYVKDSELKESHKYRFMADETSNFRLLCREVYLGLTQLNKNLKGVEPDMFIVTAKAIFYHLDADRWNTLLHVNLLTHSFKDLKQVMSSHKKFLVYVDEMDLSKVPLLIDGTKGRLSLIISLKLETLTKEIRHHSVTAIFDSKAAKFVRVCNGYPKILTEILLNQDLINPVLIDKGHTVVWSKIRFVVGNLTTLKKWGENNDETDSEDEHGVNEEIEGVAEQLANLTAEDEENVVQNLGDEARPQLIPRNNAPRRRLNIDITEMPNLNVNPLPKTIEIRILARDGVQELKWVGTLIAGEYYCRNRHGHVPCNVRGKSLKKDDDEYSVKLHLEAHRRCHTGVKKGQKSEYPIQPSH